MHATSSFLTDISLHAYSISCCAKIKHTGPHGDTKPEVLQVQ